MTYSTEVLADSPVAYWRLGETSGTTAVDEQSAHPGTVHGATLGAAGLIESDADTSYSFDGVDDYVEVPYSSALNPATFSVEFWMQSDDYATNVARPVASYDGSGKGWRSYIYDLGGSPYIVAKTDDPEVAYQLPDAAGTYHVVFTYDGTDLRLYVDKVLVAGPTAATYAQNTTVPVRIGNRSYDLTSPFDGRIDEVAVYNTVLTPTRIAAHYEAAAGPDATSDWSAWAQATTDVDPSVVWRKVRRAGAWVDITGRHLRRSGGWT